MNNGQQPKDSDWAFPVINPDNTYAQLGLTKREYFAGLAMQGILSNSSHWDDSLKNLQWASKTSVKFADALLKELEKPQS